ncbi:BrnT family toxin [Methylobacterium sp. NEAU 140]|uniref:BrnT family toxin n=1 Tax=Methylobacterium sp. NEAU 140 TaxID=3064945 RepID=UPI002735EEF1|nr:BrnT family toxin [Methylobacterium sp. NEAU 140]MDP4023440.1 BrnT family toxin [Methylobacterium sp. NEAU 140]
MRFFAQEPKRSANIAKHGFDPAEFEAAFSFDRFLSRPTKSSRTGRERVMLIGTWFDEAVVTVIVSPLGSEACDIVSVRRASLKERIAYEQT